jgi:integrase
MMLAGLRRGELLALTWNDIDIPNRRITVNKAMVMVDGKPEIKHRTKTKAGMRTVNIPRLLADFLEAERSKSKSLLVVPGLDGNLMSGDCWQSLWESYLCELNFRFGDFSGIMVTDKDGHRAQYRKPASRFAREKIPMVISKFTAHWLRHTFITNLYMAGVDVVTASKQAGHADIQTTMDIYTHLDDEFKVNQMSKLDDFLSKMG